MNNIDFPEFPAPTTKDWEYFLSFGTPYQYLDEVAKGLQEQNRYFTDFRFLKLIHWYARYCNNAISLPKGKILYRARLYNEKKDCKEKDSSFQGYGEEDSFVPPDGKLVPNGRANPDGIVYLYTAHSINTAIAEVYPPLKSEVSVAEIEILEQLTLLSFCFYCASTAGEDTDILAWQRHLVLALARLFNRHYSNSRDYILCQYISEFVKNIGFDGIAFRSSKVIEDRKFPKRDRNYTIFNYQKCKPISSKLYYISDHQYTLKVQNADGVFEAFEE